MTTGGGPHLSPSGTSSPQRGEEDHFGEWWPGRGTVLRWGSSYYTGRMNDALARKSQADLIIDRTAQQLGLLLKEAALELRPFPAFPGAFFTNAVEVNLEGVERSDLGCIVVGEDGELYELEVKIDFGDDVIDMVQSRNEALKKLEDLHPRDYAVLAYNALTQLTELLLESTAEGA